MTKAEIAALLTELEADLKKGEEEAVAALRKADGEPPKEDADPAGGEDSTSPATESSTPAGPPDASAGGPPPDASAGGPPPADPAAAPGAGDPAAESQLTPEALMAEYAQLPPEELDMHIQAALQAKESLAAAAGPAGAPGAGAPPMAPPAGPAAGPGAGAPPDASAGGPPMPPMGKADLNINKKANGGQITGGKVSKSETDEKVLALIKSQQEDIENLTKAITSVLSAPVRRSITALSEVPELKKSEPAKAMSRKEVDAFISENVHKMTKSDRELWLQFVDNKVPASKLAPMLDRLTSK